MGNFSDKLSGEPAAEPAAPLTFAQKLADDTPEPPGMFSSKLEEVEADYLANGGVGDALYRGTLSIGIGTIDAHGTLHDLIEGEGTAPRPLANFADKLRDIRDDTPRMPGLLGEFVETAPSILPAIAGASLAKVPGLRYIAPILMGTGSLRIYNEMHQAGLQAGLSDREAAKVAVGPGIVGAASEMLGGRMVAGAKPLAASGARTATRAVSRLMQRVRGSKTYKAFKGEGFTEAFQTALADGVRIGYDPNTDILDPGVFKQALKDAFKSFVFGGVLGGGASVLMDATGMTREEFHEHIEESVDESWLERDVKTLTFSTLEQDARAQVGFDTQDTIDAQMGIEMEQLAAPAAPGTTPAVIDALTERELGIVPVEAGNEEGDFHFEGTEREATNCTGYACGLRRLAAKDPTLFGGQEVEVWGFGGAGPKQPGLIYDLAEGHDFAVVGGRFIVDPWLTRVEKPHFDKKGVEVKSVYDLHNPADAARVEELYGPSSGWEHNTTVEEDSDSTDPNRVPTPALVKGQPEVTKERLSRFSELAYAQRGKPEYAMQDAVQFLGGGEMSIAEHVGDLTHRMAQSGTVNFRGGYEWVKEKVDMAVGRLANDDEPGKTTHFAANHEGGVESNARHFKKDPAEFKATLHGLFDTYSEEHAKLPVYNEVQRLARDAAVKLGRRDFDGALADLQALKDITDQGPEVWQRRALEEFGDEGALGTTPTPALVESQPEVTELPSDEVLRAMPYLPGTDTLFETILHGGGTSVVRGQERTADYISRSSTTNAITVHYTPSDLLNADPRETDSVDLAGWREGLGTTPTPARRRGIPVGLSLDVQTHDTEGTQEIGPVWYSAAERAIKKWPQKKGTAVQVIAHLKKHGISDHELDWSGIGDLLREDPDRVFTREEVLGKLLAGQLRVEEELHEQIDGVNTISTGRSAFETARQYEITYGAEPGSVPSDEMDTNFRVDYGAHSYIETVKDGPALSRTELGPSKQWELLVSLPDFEGELQAAAYEDPHFGPHMGNSAQGTNIFFLRMSERYIGGEQVLFVDELQSDWHLNRRKQQERDAERESDDGRAAGEGFDADAVVRLGRGRRTERENKIPDVMSTTWTDAGVKRAIRFAAERGYKKVVFTNALASRVAVGINLQKAHNLYGKRARNFARKFAKRYNSQVYDVGNLQTQAPARLEQSARESFSGIQVAYNMVPPSSVDSVIIETWYNKLKANPEMQWDHQDEAREGDERDADRAHNQRFEAVHADLEPAANGSVSISIFGREYNVRPLDEPSDISRSEMRELVNRAGDLRNRIQNTIEAVDLPRHRAGRPHEDVRYWQEAVEKAAVARKRQVDPDSSVTDDPYTTHLDMPRVIEQFEEIIEHLREVRMAAIKSLLSEEDLAQVEAAEANPVDAMNSRSIFDQRGVDRRKNASLQSMGHDPASVAGMDPEAAATAIEDVVRRDVDLGRKRSAAGEEELEKEHKKLVAELESYALPWAIDVTPEMKEAALVGGVSMISPKPRGLPVGLSMAMWNDVTTTGADPGTMNNQPAQGPAGESVDLLLDPARVAKNIAQFWYQPLLDTIDESGSATGRRVVESARRVVRISDGLFGQWQPMLSAYQRKLGRQALKGKGGWQRWKDLQALMDVPRLPGRNYGESLFSRAVENDEVFEFLSDYQKEIVEGYREFVETTGQEAERRGIHIMNGTESSPFQHTPGGRKFLRQFTEDYYQLLQQGESNPRVWDALLTALSEMNDLDHEVTLRQMKRMKAMALDRKQSFEVMRVFPRFPTHIWVPNGRGGESVVELMNSDPFTAATSLVRNAAYRMGFIDQFGQGHGFTGLPQDRRSSLELNVQVFAEEGGDPELMEQLFRTLNGLPRVMIEKIKVGTPAWRTMRGANYAITARAGGALSTAYIPNMPETLAKLPAAVGARRLAKTYGMFARGAMTKRGRAQLAALRQDLIRAGAVQPDVMKVTIDPEHKSREISRFVSQAVTTPRRIVDDQNEFIAAAAGLAMAKDLQQGNGTQSDHDALTQLYHFSAADAQAMMDGTASQETYDALVREVVKWSQNTIASPSELSRMATGPVASKVVKFDRFAQFTADRFLQLYRLAAPSLKGKGNAESRRHLRRLATFMAGSSLAGGLQVVMRAALWGGLVGLEDLWDDVEREPMDFIMEAFMAATFSGSLEALRSSTLGPRVTPLPMVAERLMYPLSTAGELYGVMSAVVFNLFPESGERGRGPYTGLKTLEAVSVFANRSLSISGPIRYWASVVGLGDQDAEVLSATRSYYRWRSKNMRGISIAENRNERVEDVRFRAALRRATKASIHGDMKGFVKHINEALGNVNDPQKVADSLRGRRFLPKIDKNKRAQFRRETLPAHYRVLEQLDAKLSALADIYQKLSPQPEPKEEDSLTRRLLEQGAKLLSPKEAGAAGPQPRHGAFKQPQHTQAQVWAADGELVGQFTNALSAKKGTNGLRNNNPGNLERSPDYFGKLKGAGYGDKKRFATFDTMFHGIRAIGVDIRAKLNPLRPKKKGGQLHNIEQIIRTYAPSNENKTQDYIKKVEDFTGIPRGQQLSARTDKAQMKLLVAAIIRAENSFAVEPSILARAVEDAWTPR